MYTGFIVLNKFFAGLLCWLVLLLVVPGFEPIYALTCGANISPSEILTGASSSLTYAVTSEEGETAMAVKIVNTDTGVFSITSGSASGWSASVDGDTITYTGGTLAAGASASFSLVVNALTESGAVSFDLSLSPDGASYSQCGGSGEVASSPSAPQPPVISNANLTVGNSSAVLTWTTNVAATGIVNYGTTSGYGSSGTSASGTTHSVAMGGLSASTTYHYQIQVTGDNGTTQYGDATFTTAAANVTTTTTSVVTTTTTNVVTKIVEIRDTTPPSVILSGLDKKVYTRPPEISGTVSDSFGVLEVEYSLDDGKNWAKIAMDGERGDKRSKFTFEPDVSADGTYATLVRGVDISGNKSVGKEITFVLDQLDPAIGPGVFQVGLSPLYPDGNGALHVPVNVDVLVVLPEIGGSDSVELTVGGKKYSLKKESATGLWRGVIRLTERLSSDITAEAVDGAGNTTKRVIAGIESESWGSVVDESGKGESGVEITVFVYDTDQKDFKRWDGLSRGIDNPLETNEKGEFELYLPKGRYYLRLERRGLGVIRSTIFETGGFEEINPTITFENRFRNWWWGVLSAFDFWPEVPLAITRPSLSKNSSLGSLFPVDLLVRETVVVLGGERTYLIGNSNLPLPKLGVGMVYVGFFESLSRAKSFIGKTGFETAFFADPLGKLMKDLPLYTLPSVVRVDSSGVIKEIVWGSEISSYLVDND